MNRIKQFFDIVFSLFSVVIINLIILFNRIFSKKKIGFFYHPKKNLTKNHIDYIEKYFSQYKDFLFFYGSLFFFKRKGYYLIKPFFLKFIYGVDIFFSNNVSDKFTHSSKKIYIHHDIFDTPLVEPKKENELKKRLIEYDYIIVSSDLTKKIFLRLFKKINSYPKLLSSKYLKLDYFLKKIKVNQKKICKKILIAPTNFRSFPTLSIQKNIDKIIFNLLNLNFKVIYRPHPSNFLEKNVLNIFHKYKDNKNFIIDKSNDYSKSFQSSDIMITDISGTAYTYVVLNSKPVIFFSNEREIKKFNYNQLNYFKLRTKIGYIAKNIKSIEKVLISKNILIKKKSGIMKMRKFFLNQKKINIRSLIKN